MTTLPFTAISKATLLASVLLFSLSFYLSCTAFVVPSSRKKITTQKSKYGDSLSTRLHATESSELFKAGLLADEESQERAVELASKKLRTISDLGWKGSEARRRSSIRPKLWPFGGSDELAIQDKANYSPENPNCPEPWLGLEEFYGLVNDDTAAADIIFVSLGGGRAFVERDIAESVLDRWWGNSSSAMEGSKKSRRGQKKNFDRIAFEQTVKAGQRDFITAWSVFLGFTGFALVGIVFPTNPLQLALVDLLDSIF
mmetsp:Transcript_8146/g.17562  ORF Transcript_8146/g.17562 Transcript_8146/m.17562 type:complete len:257 (-) Transcript_8146:136-906(-)|eukprot:CAMPEP_0168187632 /NCGR_PEP_ID=MMETSP0139_2-20121125/15152_1 /TAXON_ID=44445 /ORGANISM="Pseudo-nitzschia australis, Strain 10249 10 AB" /LENGTH=256 /DNA_ID=CAMNT_0008109885 /DNA_START=225 /DNA_END=995 /DNA_ORIENTATION=+